MGKVKVMIVEDDPMVTFLHRALLIKRNICSSPKNFMNGIEALDFIFEDSQRNKEDLYLVLLDINMPLMNGWEFLAALQNTEVAKRTSVVIVTSSPHRGDRQKAKEIELVTEYLEKPLVNMESIREIKIQLEKRYKN